MTYYRAIIIREEELASWKQGRARRFYEIYTPDSSNILTRKLAKSPYTPTLISFDTNELVVRLDTLPTVTSLQRKKLLENHLAFTYRGYEAVAAHVLPADKKSDQQTYITAGVKAPRVWLNLLGDWLDRHIPLTYAALPLELFNLLRPMLPKFQGQPLKWHMVLAETSSGWRVIVSCEQDPILVRQLAALPNMLADEIRRTLTYLTRTGYEQGEVIGILVISNHGIARDIANQLPPQCQTQALTPHIVAQNLKLKIAGDAALEEIIATALMHRKPYMDMTSPSVSKKQKQANLQRWAFVAAGFLLVLQLGALAFDMLAAITQTNAQNQIAVIEQQTQARIATIRQELDLPQLMPEYMDIHKMASNKQLPDNAFLATLSALRPAAETLETASFSDATLALKGTTTSISELNDMVKNIQKKYPALSVTQELNQQALASGMISQNSAAASTAFTILCSLPAAEGGAP